MSREQSSSFSECLVLDDSKEGVVITGIKDETIAAKSGLQAGDELVAATIHLDNYDKNQVLDILKVLEPYQNNMKVLTKKDLGASAGLGSLELDGTDPKMLLESNLARSGLSGGINGPTVNGDLPSLSLNKLSADADGNFTLPSTGLTGTDVKADLGGALKAPDVSVSTSQLKTPNASIDIDKPELKTGNAKYKAPKFSMPHFSLPQIGTSKAGIDGDLDLPSVSGRMDTPDLNLSAPKLESDLDLNGPKLDLNSPDYSLKAPNADINASPGHIKWPHLNWKGPKAKVPDADLNADINAPDINLNGDLDLPSVSGRMDTPDLNLSAPKLESDLDLNGPKLDLNSPDYSLKAPNADINASPGHIKWPHLNWKGPKAKVPDADLNADINAPDINLITPKIDGKLNSPNADINMPKANIKSPDLNVETPDLNIDTPPGKFNWPHLKWKKPKADLGLDANLNTPDVDPSLPTVDGKIDVPDVDLQTPGIDVDARAGKINWPHLKWKKPKADVDLDPNLNTPDFDLSVPTVDGKIDPDLDINLPKAKSPDLNIDASPGKINWPHLKAKKPKADFDAGLKTPDVNYSAPQIEADFAQNVDLNAPQVDLNAPDVDINASSGKINWPHLKWKKPRIHGPKADLNADLSTPDVDVALPKGDLDIDPPSGKVKFPTVKKPKFTFPRLKTPHASLDADLDPHASVDLPKADIDVKAPNADIEASSGKIKWPTLKKPKWSTSTPKIDGPDVDLNPDVPDLNLPSLNGEVNLPKAELEAPKCDLDPPDLDAEGPSGKFKLFNFKKPKFGTLKGPKADIDADLNVPDVDLKGPDVDLSAANLDLSTPKIEGGIDTPDLNINMPNTAIKGPDVDVNGPDLNLEAPDHKWKLPNFKFPKFKGPNIKGPDIDADASLDLPKVDVDAPNADLKAPNLSMSPPDIKGGIDTPDLDLTLPSADIKGPEADFQTPDIDGPGGKFKPPKVKLPKFGFSGPRVKAPNVDVDADLKSPDVDMSLSDLHAELPKADLTAPDVNVKSPGLNLSPLDVSTPDIDLNPDLSLSNTNIGLPDLSLPTTGIKGPDMSLNLPKGDVNAPSLDLPKADLKIPDLSPPSLTANGNISAPDISTKLPKAELDTPNVTMKSPNVDINLPKSDLKAPDAQLKTPDIDLDQHLGDFDLPHYKLPNLGYSGSEGEFQSPKINIATPSVDANGSVEMSAPKVDASIKGLEEDLKAPTVDANLEKPKLPHFKLPKFNLFGSKKKSEEDVSADLEEEDNTDTDVANTEMEVPAFIFHRLPRHSIDDIGGIADSFGLSKLDTEDKDYVVSKGIRLPIVNASSKAGEKIDIMERLKMAREKISSTNVSPTDDKTDGGLNFAAPSLDVGASSEAGDSSLARGGTFKVDNPESVLGLVAPEISTSDENDKFSLGLSNMLGLTTKN